MRESKAGRVLTEAQGVRLDGQLTMWRDELVNLTKRNRLLYFKHTKLSSLEIVEPAAASVFVTVQALVVVGMVQGCPLKSSVSMSRGLSPCLRPVSM